MCGHRLRPHWQAIGPERTGTPRRPWHCSCSIPGPPNLCRANAAGFRCQSREIARVQPSRARVHRSATERRAAAAFEMEVILVRGVVFRAKHGAKTFAGALMHHPQEFARGCIAAVPVALEHDPAPVS
jgi:hypothetical protein